MHQQDPVRSALSFFHGKERGSDLRRLASERQWVASLNLTTREKLIIGSADMRQSCCQPSSYYQQSTL